nr:hypothetical protein [Tanacetum cinerariifolium]
MQTNQETRPENRQHRIPPNPRHNNHTDRNQTQRNQNHTITLFEVEIYYGSNNDQEDNGGDWEVNEENEERDDDVISTKSVEVVVETVLEKWE